VAEHLEIADTALKRTRGLLGRTSFPPGSGLWIEPCSSIHMFFMLFAIDVIYLDEDRRVVKLVHRLRPFLISAARGARSVVEIPAGTLEHVDVRNGDILEVRDPIA